MLFIVHTATTSLELFIIVPTQLQDLDTLQGPETCPFHMHKLLAFKLEEKNHASDVYSNKLLTSAPELQMTWN